jgi:hypothetical protein
LIGTPARETGTRAMHFVGTACKGWGAQAGFGLRPNKTASYDASMYDGVAFWARLGNASSDDILTLEISTADTNRDAGICDDPNTTTGVHTPDDDTDDCFGNYTYAESITTTWKEIVVPFAGLTKNPGNGPAAIDKTKLMQVMFSWKLTTNNFDVWIDDIRFYTE